ncbi:MAG: hypothetical protein VX265_10255 [Myxococcota bacterium]|nr:hypothetical protein [Myxococcota bacterium]
MDVPSPTLFALLERIHGHLAWLGLALMVHPVFALRRPGPPGRPTRTSAWLAAGLVTAPYGIGWLIYPTYRERVKPGLLIDALPYALAFETKEHLALMTLALAWGGALCLHFGGGSPAGRRAARVVFACGALTGVATGLLGIIVASRAHGAW